MRITDALLHPAANNLNLTRLILALTVIYSHSWHYFTGVDADDLTWLLGWPVSHYGVDGFFFLSGFLVYRSLVQNSSVPRFALARLTRLLPGLIAMLVLVTAAGAWATRLPLAQYATDPATWKFLLYNSSLVRPAYILPGIACPDMPCSVNGSLWSLPWEARCYLALVLLSLLGLARRRTMLALVLPLSFAFTLAWALAAADKELVASLDPGKLYYIRIAARLWTAFALGILAYELRERIPLSWLGLGAIFLLNVAVQHMAPEFGIPMRALFCMYLVLCLGFLTARKGSISARWPDCSYGMYIYAYPVMLAAAALLPLHEPYSLALANVILAAPLALASWFWVEKPALDWLRRRQKTAFRAASEPDTAQQPSGTDGQGAGQPT